MASGTLNFTGFSRDETASIQAEFDKANRALGNHWSQAPEAEARVLVIDMDSMYGHMTWLKAQGTGKVTVGVTTGERSETDHLLKRPVTDNSLRELLVKLEGGAGTAPAKAAPAAPPTAPAVPSLAAPASVQAATAVAQTQTAWPVSPPPPSPTMTDPSADYLAAVTTGQMAAMGPTIPHQPRISDYLAPGRLGGPAKLKQLDGTPVVAFDPGTQTYAGSATLKPLLPYVEAVLEDADLEAIDGAEFERIKAASGGAQPYMRLLWLCGLSVGKGNLLPGYHASRKFQLTKWPQIEREYPKHFRLATVMMKGPALVKDIAELSGVPEADVIDFVNAGLITGAVVVDGSPTSAGDVARASALLAKPRVA